MGDGGCCVCKVILSVPGQNVGPASVRLCLVWVMLLRYGQRVGKAAALTPKSILL